MISSPMVVGLGLTTVDKQEVSVFQRSVNRCRADGWVLPDSEERRALLQSLVVSLLQVSFSVFECQVGGGLPDEILWISSVHEPSSELQGTLCEDFR